jgi:hypothetical protein
LSIPWTGLSRSLTCVPPTWLRVTRWNVRPADCRERCVRDDAECYVFWWEYHRLSAPVNVCVCVSRNDVLACYEKERAARLVKSARMLRKRACSRRVQKSARMLRKSSRPGRTDWALGRQSTGADTGSWKAVDRGGHGQLEGSRPGRSRAAGGQSTGADKAAVGRLRGRLRRWGALAPLGGACAPTGPTSPGPRPSYGTYMAIRAPRASASEAW